MAIPVILSSPAPEAEQSRQQGAIEELEISLLLEGIYQLGGEDFRGFDRGRLRQKVHALLAAYGLQTVSGLQEQVLRSEPVREALLRALQLRSSPMFDNADQYRVLRTQIGPLLRSYADPRVWLAEAGSAEDVFSLIIVLIEEGLYDRTTVFATSANEALFEEIRIAGFASEHFARYEANYQASGGRRSLTDYCEKRDGQYVFRPELARNLTWAQYNLTTDTSFNEFQLIVCRRPLDDFATVLRRRTLGLFNESLVRFGLLAMVEPHDLSHAMFAMNYSPVAPDQALYRRIT